jgi:catechol 2,3-dioxygenase-like lactoylglutathione lyase family enzyme
VKIVDKIILTHLLVSDMDKAKAFYTDVLGFEATQDTKWGKGNRGVFVFLQAAAHTLLLISFPKKKSSILRELHSFKTGY